MASVQKKTTKTVKTKKTTGEVQTTSVSVAKSEHQEFSSHTTSSKCLQITRRGQFFNDSYFQDSHQDFQDAVRDVLSKTGSQVTTSANDLASYRSLRDKEIKDETQAVRSTDSERHHKIVIDVQDFIKGGDVTVKTVDERELVVEGRVERKEGNATSMKSFQRSFILPDDVILEEVSSVMSSDGILTVTAPRKAPAIQFGTTTVNQQSITSETTADGTRRCIIIRRGAFNEDSVFDDSRKQFQNAVTQVLVKCKEKKPGTDDLTTYRNLRRRNLKLENQAVHLDLNNQCHKIILDVAEFLTGDVTVSLPKPNELKIEGKGPKQDGASVGTQSFSRGFILPDDADVGNIKPVLSSDGILVVITPMKGHADQFQIQSTDTTNKVTTTTTTTTTISSQDTTQNARPLPIAKKGDFFKDTFFEDTRQPFQTAVRNVLERCNEVKSQTDDITTYRNLRQRNLKDENQAITTTETDQFHKILVDVQDFISGGEVTVKTVDEREIVIEGHVVRQEGNTKSTKRFCRRFVLAEDIDVESVTSVVSADGVLTVIAPKKPQPQQLTSQVTKKVITTKTTTTTTTGEEVSTQSEDQTDQQSIEEPQNAKPLPIVKKGDFFKDTFFEDSRQHFQTAVRNVLEKFNERNTQTDDITTYRILRQRNLKEENQVITTNETDHFSKMIVDVKDFIDGGEVTVKIVNNREVVIEGHVEKQEETKKSIKRFRKRFILAENIEVESVTSVVSSDGILTVTAPKKPQQPQGAIEPSESQVLKVTKKVTKTTTTTGEETVEEPTPKPVQVVQNIQENVQNVDVVNVQKQVTTVNQENVVTSSKVTDDTAQVKKAPTESAPVKKVPEQSVPTAKAPGEKAPTDKKPTTDVTETETTVTDKTKVTTTEITTTDVTDSKQTKTESLKTTDEQVMVEKTPTEKAPAGKAPTEAAPTEKAPTQKAPAGKAPIEAAPTEKAPTEKAPAGKAPTEAAPTEKAPTEKAPAGKAPTEAAPTEKAPTEKAPAGKAPTEATPTEKTPTEKIPAGKAPTEAAPVEKAPAGKAPTEAAPAEKAPTEKAPAEKAPTEKTPSGKAPTEAAPAGKTPTEKAPVEEAPMRKAPAEAVQTEAAPAEKAPAGKAPTEAAPAEKAPSGKAPTEEAPTQKAPTEKAPAEKAPTGKAPTEAAPAEKAPTKKAPADQTTVDKTTTDVNETDESTTSKTKTTTTTTTFIIRRIVIITRETFYEDIVFEEYRQLFQTAIKKILQKHNEKTETDDLTTYRNLRRKKTSMDTQAVDTEITEQCYKIILDVRDYMDEEIIITHISEKEIKVESKGKKTFTRTFVVPDGADVDNMKPVLSSDGVLVIIVPMKGHADKFQQIVSTKTTTTEEDKTKTTKTVTTKSDETKTFTKRTYILIRREIFTQDTVFEDSREHFITAVKNILEKYNEKKTETDDVTTYRNMRKRKLLIENQAVHTEVNEHCHRIILDVYDFMDGEITITLVSEQELRIEGKGPKNKGTSTGSQSFTRNFILPEGVNLNEIKPVISSDGVLVVFTPKKGHESRFNIVSTVTENTSTKKETEKTSTKKTVTTFTVRKYTIIKRQTFIQDTVFEEHRKNYQTAITEVLEKFNEKSDQTDNLTSYRRLRERKVTLDNQAVITDETEKYHVIIVDVYEFLSGEVTVTLVGERELSIEGKGAKGMGSHSFSRNFILPDNVDLDSVSPYLSSDGVLVVVSTIVQKMVTTETEEQDTANENVFKIIRREAFSKDSVFKDSRQQYMTAVKKVLEKSNEKSSEADLLITYRKMRQRKITLDNQAVHTEVSSQCHKIIVDVREFMRGEVTVALVGERELSISGKGPKRKGATGSQSFSRNFILLDGVNLKAIKAVMSSDGVLVVFSPMKGQESKYQIVSTVTEEAMAAEEEEAAEEAFNVKIYQSTKKGSFFTDPFFQDCREPYGAAINDVLIKFNEKSPNTDDVTAYRNMRQRKLLIENQAVQTEENDKVHKIIMDVQDFMNGEIKIALVGPGELRIEGRGDKCKGGGGMGSQSFMRGFIIPDEVDLDAIQPYMSSDGVLVVMSPKK